MSDRKLDETGSFRGGLPKGLPTAKSAPYPQSPSPTTPRGSVSPAARQSVSPDRAAASTPRGSVAPGAIATTPRGSVAPGAIATTPRGSIAPVRGVSPSTSASPSRTTISPSTPRSAQDKSKLATELDNIGVLKVLEEKLGLTKIQIFWIATVLLLALVLFGFGASLICDLFSLLYPAYASLNALENLSPENKDLDHWLVYWMIYALFQVSERLIDTFLWTIPFYYVIKIGFVYWLISAKYHGAKIIYDSFVQPYMTSRRSWIDSCVFEIRAVVLDILDVQTQRIRNGSAFFMKDVPIVRESVPSNETIEELMKSPKKTE